MPALVAFYARSSNDAHDVSCDSQIREFERLTSERGEIEVAHRVDSAVSHFEAGGLTDLLRLAKSSNPPPFERLYVWDTARISRILYRQAKTMEVLTARAVKRPRGDRGGTGRR
jgi:DNA invertase Pin-like site-specific DNA recombinase